MSQRNGLRGSARVGGVLGSRGLTCEAPIMDTFPDPSHICRVVDKARASLGEIIPGAAWERACRPSTGRPLGEFVRRVAQGDNAWVGLAGDTERCGSLRGRRLGGCDHLRERRMR
jgi:hypothetical protein